jgi:hypothetical protein
MAKLLLEDRKFGVETSVQKDWWARDGGRVSYWPPLSHCEMMIQESTMGKLSHTIKGSWFPMYFAKYLLHDSPNVICEVFATRFSLRILQHICYMILPMHFAKCFATWFSQWILQSVCYMILPNGFCKVFATWFSQSILQSACYMILPMYCIL